MNGILPRRTGERLHPMLILPAAALVLLLQGQTCQSSASPSGCTTEPAEPLAVYVEGGDSASVRFSGVVTAVDTTRADGFSVVTVRNARGDERRVRLRAWGSRPALLKGDSYGFVVEAVPGFPTACGLIIRDSTGIVFAGASDQSLGGHVLKQGVPEFTLALDDAGCPSRRHDECYDGLYNRCLTATHDGQSVRLFHPHSARLGDYRVTCLVAQRVAYNPRCVDAGLQAVSWTIERVPPTR